MHIVIIGGGIAGLYCAHKLIQSPDAPQVTILEAGERLGGRIHTIHKHAFVYEGGAGRFTNKHKLLLSLIKDLGLQDKIFPMKSPKLYIKDTTPLLDFDEESFIQKLIKAAAKRSPHEMKSKTLSMFMREIFLPSEVDDFIYASGYQSEFEVCNAYHALHHLKDNLMAKDHFGLAGGLSTIVDALYATLVDAGVRIKLNTPVHDFDPVSMTVRYPTGSIKADRVILCVTKDKLVRFDKLILYDDQLSKTLATIQTRPLYRIYAKFPCSATHPAWFKDLPRISTNNALRQIIPIDATKGLVMLSYTDGLWAEAWAQLEPKNLKKELMRHLRLLFPDRKIPEFEWIDAIYWEHSAHYPKPNYTPYSQPHANKYIVCGEVVTSKNNGWIEGALMASQAGLQKLLL